MVDWENVTVGISGSRSLTDEAAVFGALERACRRARPEFPSGYKVVHGGAGGVDSIAVKFFAQYPHDITVIRPDYETHGKAAPFIRNQEIVDAADYLIAIWDGRSKGTLDTIKKAAKKKIPIVVEVLA